MDRFKLDEQLGRTVLARSATEIHPNHQPRMS